MRSSELCLINRARAHYGLVPLQYNPDLRDSATGHSDSMVVHRYFAHEGPGGSVDSRISRAGYLDNAAELGPLANRLGLEPDTTAPPSYNRFVVRRPLLVAARG